MFDAITYALAKAFTKKAIEDVEAGSMRIEDYDSEGNGVVNDSRKLGGNLPSYYASTASVVGKMDKSVYDKNDNGIVDNAEKVNGHNVASDVPANAQFTDTKKLSDMTDTDFNNLVDGEAVVWDGTNEKFVNRLIQGGTTIVQIPSVVIGTYTYNGSTQSPTITGLDTTHCDVTGTSESVNAGDFTFTISLKDPTSMVWSDMTIADRTFTWSIAKADGAATLSKSTVELDSDTLSDVVTISGATGEMTITSSDATVATVAPASMSVPGGSVTISSVNNTSGNATITISVASSQNYNSTTITINVVASFLKIVTWANGTDEEIAAMLDAHYAGSIDITDYWTVGDERVVKLSAMEATGVGESHDAQSVRYVLTNVGGKTLATPINGKTTCAFQVDQKHSLMESGYMNSINDNTGGWKSSARRTWCNSVYKNAIPSTLIGIFKEFINQSGTGGGSTSGVEDTTDTFALRAEIEVLGSRTYSVANEGSQVTYYRTSSNRIKKADYNRDSPYWERSPRRSETNRFCSVTSTGGADGPFASTTSGLALFGCI